MDEMRYGIDLLIVWVLNFIGILAHVNWDVGLKRLSLVLAIVYTLMRIYGWLAEQFRKGKNESKDN